MAQDLPDLARLALTELLAGSLGSELPRGTDRRIHGRLCLPGKATAVVGVRRSGKTTFVHQLRRERMAAGTSRANLPYINFEDERLAGIEAHHLGFLLDEYGRRVPEALDRGEVLLCLDEIQLVPGWERFVRRVLDGGGIEVVITGSSAALLSREIATAMRGRAWEVPVFPFGFGEMLSHRGMADLPDPGFLAAAERARLEHVFRDYLTTGGFPEAQGLEEGARRQLLRDYVDVAMLRDVVERHAVSNVTGLRWLVRHLLGNAAGSFSVEKFHAALRSQGVTISRDTLHQLLGYLEDCFLVRTVWMESSSERQRMVNPRKVYPVDPGLIPLYDRTGRANLGHALETAVLIELERRRCAVTYVRTPGGFEVDFLARDPEGNRHLIQVCADASAANAQSRELRSLVEARRQHPSAKAWLLTTSRDGTPAAAPKDVTVCPAYQWMLADAW